MSVEKCIKKAIKTRKVTTERGKDLLDQFRERRALYDSVMSPELADARAAAELRDVLEAMGARNKRVANLRIQAAKRIQDAVLAHPGGAMSGASAHIMRDPDFKNVQIDSVSSRQQSVLGILHAKWADGLEALRPRKLGLSRNKAKLENVVRELFGQGSGDAEAAALAKSWSEAAEYARQRFNAAGGNIAKRADWGLPQMHDMQAVGKASFEEWRDFILPRLNLEKTFEGKLAVDARLRKPDVDKAIDKTLREIYDRIRTDGLIDLAPGGGTGKSLVNRHQDHRFLTFKNGDSWLEYQGKFGSSDVFATMNHHLDVMAKDIAAVEVLGPNPDWTVRFMQSIVKSNTAGTAKGVPATRLKFLEDAWNMYSGRTNAPVNTNFAHIMAGTRNILTSAQLGAAFLASITDIGFQRMARQTNGLPVMSVFRDIVKLMNPFNAADQKLAVQLGLLAENWSTQALAQKRYFGEVTGPAFSRFIADAVLKVSLLSPWTQAGRWSFGMEFLGALARESGKGFDNVMPPLRDAMKRYGISAEDWNKIRATEKVNERGAEFISPVRLAEAGQVELSNKVQQMILSEMEFAVPSVELRTSTITKQATRPGTIGGELMRSLAMYKAFPITVITTHLMRGLSMNGAQSGKYLANMFISMTILGGLAYQAKQLQKGKDPITMDPTEPEGRRFWAAAALQGGGLGIFGDFVFADVNRHGQSPAATFAGPVAQTVDDIIRMTVGNAQQALDGEETKMMAELVRAAGKYTPGSSLWYSRLAFERLVLDQLTLMADPDAHEKFRRMERQARKDYGQRYFWRPGQTTPERAPELPED